MSIPDGKELVAAIEKIMIQHPDGISSKKMDELVASLLELDESSLSELLSDGVRSKFKYRMAWARVTAKKELSLVKRNGVWILEKDFSA